LRDLGAEVVDAICIFSYGLPLARERFKEMSVNLHALVGLDALLAQARLESKISPEEEEEVRHWHSDPRAWTDRCEDSAGKS